MHYQECYGSSCLKEFSQVGGVVQGDMDGHRQRSGSSLLRLELGVKKSEV